MHYMLMPLDQHFDLGFGAVADSFKESADSLAETNEASPSLNMHLPISFLYRHAIELYLKSAIIIFHRKLRLPYGEVSFDGEPQVFIENKWKPMRNVHGLEVLHKYFRNLFSSQASYLDANTNTNWSFPNELDGWIAEIESTDSSSTFFRYPVTRNRDKDKDKSVIREDDYNNMLANVGLGQKPLKAFLLINDDDQVVQAFSHDDSLAKSIIATLQKVSEVLYGCHAALVGELTGGR